MSGVKDADSMSHTLALKARLAVASVAGLHNLPWLPADEQNDLPALCYLEAIRPKVPELILKEQSGQGSSAEFDSKFKATHMRAEPELEAQLAAMEFDTPAAWCDAEDVMDTVRVCDNEDIACMASPSLFL
ncbi:hypothetical protein R3P38DRAFT_3227939 [Favolaschia claudopus]|uniref:Uncharacterized protein n=1 Tax=Favolaschia claudopus TaxID=2862362 RepID=A0AAV9ZRF7_9AGAR